MEDLNALSQIKSELGDAVLIAVSKTKPVANILELYQEGQKIFGENYVQELIQKKAEIDALKIADLQFHFIGHLQSNKVKLVLPCVTTIHSVDSIRLYEEIIKRAELIQQKVSVFFQINIDEEVSKGGFKLFELDMLIERIKADSQKWVIPAGLMAIPNPDLDSSSAFQKMQELSLKYGKITGTSLSMGMSDDFRDAIAHGATHVRIGSALFGARV